MTLRCGCYDQADDIVFGERHQCTSKPAMLAESVQSEVEERPYERTLSDGDGDLG
jgi:hypothetical protein